MKEKIIAMLKALNLWKEEDAQKITDELDKLETPPAPPARIDTSKIADAAMKQTVEALQQTVQLITQQNKELLASLAAEKKAREDAVSIQNAQLKTEKEKKVAAAVQKLLDEGKISSDEEKALWKKTFEADLETGEKLSASLPVKPGFKPVKKDGQTPPATPPNKEEGHLPSPLDSSNTGILKAVKEFAQVTD